MVNIILPKTYVDQIEQPIIFLAGPIKGASMWQDEAIYILQKSYNPNVTVINPRRTVDNGLAPLVLEGKEDLEGRQRTWERHYLMKAGKTAAKGAILFWLTGERIHDCKKAYGAMTRAELGEWTTRKNLDSNVRLVIGSDGKFSEFRTLQLDIQDNCGKEFPIYTTLEETCKEALRLACQ